MSSKKVKKTTIEGDVFLIDRKVFDELRYSAWRVLNSLIAYVSDYGQGEAEDREDVFALRRALGSTSDLERRDRMRTFLEKVEILEKQCGVKIQLNLNSPAAVFILDDPDDDE